MFTHIYTHTHIHTHTQSHRHTDTCTIARPRIERRTLVNNITQHVISLCVYVCVFVCMCVHISLTHNNSKGFHPFHSKFCMLCLDCNALMHIKFGICQIIIFFNKFYFNLKGKTTKKQKFDK